MDNHYKSEADFSDTPVETDSREAHGLFVDTSFKWVMETHHGRAYDDAGCDGMSYE